MRECKQENVETREKAEDIKKQYEADGCTNAEITEQEDGKFTVTASC